MCDCVPSTLLPYSCIRIRIPRFTRFNSRTRTVPAREINSRYCPGLSNLSNSGGTRVRNGGLQFTTGSFGSNEAVVNSAKSKNSIEVARNSSASASNEHEFYGELGFEEREKRRIELETVENDEEMKKKSSLRNGIDMGNGTTKVDDSRSSNGPASSSVDFLEFNEDCGIKTTGRHKDEDVQKIGGSDGVDLKFEELDKANVVQVLRSGRQLMNRSNMIAKQVISIKSALSLGFVSQIWVNTNTWVVLVVEVRPNLFSGESERFLLEDISQVGDVVLIKDESVMEIEFKMVGLDTLVGYNVATPGRQNIGKVRGYTFNINSGDVQSLELDSFGISIIPSSLVSTYALFVEDVLEVVSDTVVVHEAAASRIQRLTKGFWDAPKVGNSIDDLGEYSDQERQPVHSDYGRGRGRGRSSASPNSRPKMREIVDDWELPMDYL